MTFFKLPLNLGLGYGRIPCSSLGIPRTQDGLWEVLGILSLNGMSWWVMISFDFRPDKTISPGFDVRNISRGGLFLSLCAALFSSSAEILSWLGKPATCHKHHWTIWGKWEREKPLGWVYWFFSSWPFLCQCRKWCCRCPCCCWHTCALPSCLSHILHRTVNLFALWPKSTPKSKQKETEDCVLSLKPVSKPAEKRRKGRYDFSEPFRGALLQANSLGEQVYNQVAAGVWNLTGHRSLSFWLACWLWMFWVALYITPSCNSFLMGHFDRTGSILSWGTRYNNMARSWSRRACESWRLIEFTQHRRARHDWQRCRSTSDAAEGGKEKRWLLHAPRHAQRYCISQHVLFLMKQSLLTIAHCPWIWPHFYAPFTGKLLIDSVYWIIFNEAWITSPCRCLTRLLLRRWSFKKIVHGTRKRKEPTSWEIKTFGPSTKPIKNEQEKQ